MSLVTIVVLNYNYGRFVAQAIESALAQTYDLVEVVVVDNGSTDHSLEVIAPFERRARVVRQATNIGQGQGYNLGFEAARGEWIIWLDADDLLDTDAIESCMSLVAVDTAKVQFPLRLVDADGNRLGGQTPFLRHDGDVVPIIRQFGHYAGPPGSGNLYRRSAVAPYFPVPPAQWPICTDTVPFLTAPFHGRVADTGRAVGSYRLHAKATRDIPGYSGNYSVDMASEVRLNAASRDGALALLLDRSGINVQGPFLTLPTHMRHRIISWRWAPNEHPYANDDARTLRRQMAVALETCPGYSAFERFLMYAWTVVVLYFPLPVASALMSSSGPRRIWSSLTRRFKHRDTVPQRGQ